MKKIFLALIILVLGGKIFCQTFTDTLNTIVAEAKMAELKLTKVAIVNGEQATISGNPAVIWENDTITVKVTFTDKSLKIPTTFLLLKNEKIFLDNDYDGKINVFYSGSGPFKTYDQKMVAQLITRSGEISQTEVDLASIMQKNLDKVPFVMYNLDTKMFYSTDKNRAEGIMQIPSDYENRTLKKCQEKFLATIK